MTPRLRALAGGLVLLAALVAVALVDAGRRRPRSGPDHEAAVSLGLPDLVLSSAERWLRHPSQAEPGAAVSDLPGAPDVDPAGALIGPPRAVLRVGGVEPRRR
ncbi:MAG: hypothetical protein VYE22_09465 [Myxococcota bacterium]|nr:hypothetical protein [Myxococcota bacterium]